MNTVTIQFVAPDKLPKLQASLMRAQTTHGMKGTALLAGQSIDFCPPPGSAAIHEFLAWLRFDRCIQMFEVKKNRREPGACADGQDCRD